ncbi:YcxB family protein [Roseiflexus castenholzii]|uniref:YcxB family protein n=1 Tax=Roseiflexus castenholzii TaxID=120962 RepID=UPI003C7AD444
MTTVTQASTQSVTLRYTHTLDEQLHACRLYQRSTRKHLFYKFVAIVAIFSAVWIVFTVGVQPAALLLLALGLFTWFDPVPLLLVWSTFRSSPALRQPIETVFDRKGVHFRFGTERVSRSWERYQSFAESDRVFVLIHSRWAYSVVPKRAFADRKAIDEFRELLRANIRRSS